MRADTIRRILRNLDVPIARAQWAAEKYGDDTNPIEAHRVQAMIDREARRIAIETERRKFRAWCRANEIPNPTHEFRFSKQRRWRADWAWPDPGGGGVLLEIDGGGHVRGRHHRHAGFVKDQEKRNAALALGFTPLHVTPETLCTDATLDLLRTALRHKEIA